MLITCGGPNGRHNGATTGSPVSLHWCLSEAPMERYRTPDTGLPLSLSLSLSLCALQRAHSPFIYKKRCEHRIRKTNRLKAL